MKKLFLTLIVALCCLMARDASATSIDFINEGAYSSINVTLSTTGWYRNYGGTGGEMEWVWLSGAPSGYSGSFYAYCVDLMHNLTDPQTVTILSTDVLATTSDAGPYVANAGQKAAWLYNSYASGVHSEVLANNVNAGTDAAALQIAIWEALYDTDTYASVTALNSTVLTGAVTANGSGSGGAFTLSSNSAYAAINTKALSYLTGLYSSTAYLNSSANWLDAVLNAGQDQIWAPPVTITSTVPEPASIVFLGTGLLALAHGIRRRQRRGARTAEPVVVDQLPSA